MSALSPQTLMLLLLSVLVVGIIDPVIPLLAYLLQLWAGSSWMWRDRWASLTAAARKGGVYITCLITYVLLNQTHLWIIPGITANLQTIWHAHFPGILSLSLDGHALLARSLLLLPLTPAIALLYEWMHPRTHHPLQRILTPADLAEPAITAPEPAAEPVVPPEPKPEPPTEPATTPPAPKKHKARTTQHTTAIKNLQVSKPHPEPPSTPPSQPQPAPEINWNDLAE